MNCREAKVAIALHLGQDEGDLDIWEGARRHASTCMDCRAHYKNLKKSMAVLEQADVEETYEVRQSLWPEVQSRLASQPGLKREQNQRTWTPFVSVAVACLLFVMVWANPPQEPKPGQLHHPQGRGMGAPFASTIQQPRDTHDQNKENLKDQSQKENETL